MYFYKKTVKAEKGMEEMHEQESDEEMIGRLKEYERRNVGRDWL